MRDSQHGGQAGRGADGVSAFARSVLARLVVREAQQRRGPEEELLKALCRAVVSSGPGDLQALRDEIRRLRISEIDLADHYLPAIARRLGADWCDDQMSFAEVSIGLARLQAILHDLGRDWKSNDTAQPDSATVLLILPEGEQHSFGVFLLAGQLRRRGITVQVQISATSAGLGALVAQRHFDCAMISVACEEKLELCRKVVTTLKKMGSRRMRVVVGGAVLERGLDVKAATGADLVTNDLDLALDGLGVAPALPADAVE